MNFSILEPITIFGQCGGTGYDGYNVCVLGK